MSSVQAHSHGGEFWGSAPLFFCALQIFVSPEEFVLNIHNKNIFRP